MERKDIVPDYNNQPDYDDICGLRCGRDHYVQYFPSPKRHLSNEPFVKCNYLIVINMLACLRDSHIRRIGIYALV